MHQQLDCHMPLFLTHLMPRNVHWNSPLRFVLTELVGLKCLVLGHLNSRCYSWPMFPIYNLRAETQTSLDLGILLICCLKYSRHNDSRYFHSCSELIHVKMKGNAFLCFSFVNVILQINQHCLCKNVSLWACCCMQGYSEWCVVYDYQTQMQFL